MPKSCYISLKITEELKISSRITMFPFERSLYRFSKTMHMTKKLHTEPILVTLKPVFCPTQGGDTK